MLPVAGSWLWASSLEGVLVVRFGRRVVALPADWLEVESPPPPDVLLRVGALLTPDPSELPDNRPEVDAPALWEALPPLEGDPLWPADALLPAEPPEAVGSTI